MKLVCSCRNHLGRPKVPYKTRLAAVEVWGRHGRDKGGVYRCPTSDRWHVTVHQWADLPRSMRGGAR